MGSEVTHTGGAQDDVTIWIHKEDADVTQLYRVQKAGEILTATNLSIFKVMSSLLFFMAAKRGMLQREL